LKAIFLDRDGVVNRAYVSPEGKPLAPRKIEELVILPRVKKKLIQIKRKNFLIIIVSNQPDIGNKIIKKSTVDYMHSILMSKLPITEIFYCPHSQKANCSCRKPKDKLFSLAIKKYNITPKKSFMIGDRKSDIEAVSRIGIPSIFIDRRYKEKKPTGQICTVNSSSKALEYVLCQ
jgi:D-glycero-D-manno-heptose 1,7-bisphosphate phosphatase